MKLSYETLLSPTPIKLSVGNLRKPTLRELSELTFSEFNGYKFFLKLTPKMYYEEILKSPESWSALTTEKQNGMTLYDCIMDSEMLQKMYSVILNFFFIENVIYQDGVFMFFETIEDKMQIVGVAHAEKFESLLLIIQQICMIYEEPKKEEIPVFKNALARKLYEKQKKAEDEKAKRETKKMEPKLSLANIISSVSNFHKTISPITVWDLTLFQLYDAFKRMQINESYEMNKTSVSVYGDEKNRFDSTLWYEDMNKEKQDSQ